VRNNTLIFLLNATGLDSDFHFVNDNIVFETEKSTASGVNNNHILWSYSGDSLINLANTTDGNTNPGFTIHKIHENRLYISEKSRRIISTDGTKNGTKYSIMNLRLAYPFNYKNEPYYSVNDINIGPAFFKINSQSNLVCL